MTQQTMLEELEAVAAHLEVKVSYESLAASVGSGGLCRVHGEYRVIIEKRAQLGERVAALGQALAQLPALSPESMAAVAAGGGPGPEMSPSVRHLLRHYHALRRAS